MLAHHDCGENGSPVPTVGADLVAAEAQGYFKGLQADRVMAALELLRHGEISMEQAAGLSGLSREALAQLIARLPVSGFRL
jgi:hypothetical protein